MLAGWARSYPTARIRTAYSPSVSRPDGRIAVRDADYAAMAWHPHVPGLDLWRDTYRAAARANGAEPDAGRLLRSWANQAGLSDVRVGSSTWTYADPASTEWWGTSQATRYSSPVFAAQAAELGVGQDGIDEIASGWRTWGSDPDAWFVVLHGELLARPGQDS